MVVRYDHALRRGLLVPVELHRKLLWRQLEKAAAKAAEQASAALVQVVLCEYMGRRDEGNASSRCEPDPSRWQIPEGERHSQQEVQYMWTLHDAVCFTTVRCDNARIKGVPRPSGWQLALCLGDLVQAAKAAEAKFIAQDGFEFSETVRCKYLGQRVGVSYIADPGCWEVGKGWGHIIRQTTDEKREQIKASRRYLINRCSSTCMPP